MKVVILAGGMGTRISEESHTKPKPMIEVGGYPILWHIMKEYSYYGHNDFIICAGYKQEMIKEWVANLYLWESDFTIDMKDGKNELTIHKNDIDSWRITVVNTGLHTMTGGRLKRISEYIGDETFMMTYGDGVCDVEIDKLIDFHKKHGKIATLTAVTQDQEKGVLSIDENNSVRSFREKKVTDGAVINAGYMVFEPEIFNYIDGDETILERDPLETLAEEGQLKSYHHHGFWQCMDNMRELKILRDAWESGTAPWRKW